MSAHPLQIYYKIPGSVSGAAATAATLNNMVCPVVSLLSPDVPAPRSCALPGGAASAFLIPMHSISEDDEAGWGCHNSSQKLEWNFQIVCSLRHSAESCHGHAADEPTLVLPCRSRRKSRTPHLSLQMCALLPCAHRRPSSQPQATPG